MDSKLEAPAKFSELKLSALKSLFVLVHAPHALQFFLEQGTVCVLVLVCLCLCARACVRVLACARTPRAAVLPRAGHDTCFCMRVRVRMLVLVLACACLCVCCDSYSRARASDCTLPSHFNAHGDTLSHDLCIFPSPHRQLRIAAGLCT